MLATEIHTRKLVLQFRSGDDATMFAGIFYFVNHGFKDNMISPSRG